MNQKANFPPLPWEGKGEATSAAKSVRRLASVTFGPRCSALLSRSELLSSLRSDLPLASARKIDLIVLHCSDTRPSQQYTVEMLARDHKRRGFGDYPGYHFFVRRDGTLHYCRPLHLKGCHVAGYNMHSIGVCYEGGHREDSPPLVSKYEDNRTAEQKEALHELLSCLKGLWPEARICGHRDLPGVAKACPCFDAEREYNYLR